MNLRDLQYLVTTADELHFGRAAELCNVSQPTLSMQLKKLEDTLGTQLFERTNKSVRLTETGRDVVAHARNILAEAEQIRQLAHLAADPLAGEIRLGVFPTLAPYLLPSLMPKLKNAFPKLNVLLVEEKTPELVNRLSLGEIDCALLAMPVAQGGFSALPLFNEPFLVAVPVSHRLAGKISISYDDIRQETMLLLEDGHCLREQALDVCHTIGIGEANRFRATSLETLLHMVASGNNITLVPKLAIRRHDDYLRYIPFSGTVPFRTIGLYSRPTSARKVLFAKIAELIKDEYAHL
ncbi:MAG TPA: LysR substrate-binding domain-containing protein [Rickettsiales bacterium]|nr:LysR substrate-binding domain-containing protein [Rickettsiales bacterium]